MDIPCIQTENLVVGYTQKNQQKILATGLHLSAQKGQLIALVGQNGVGKSTLLRTLCQLQKPLAGKVNLQGKNAAEYPLAELAQQLSVVLTEKLPPSNLTVWELVALGRQPYTNWIGQLTEQDQQAINHALIATDLSGIQHQKHYTLSDGQLQKALIARALAQETPLIVLDEPTTHLDLVHKLKLLKLLKNLCLPQEKCILFSTHDIEMGLVICDELIVMTPEQVVQGTPEKLIETGVIARLFSDADIKFDAVSKKFNLTI